MKFLLLALLVTLSSLSLHAITLNKKYTSYRYVFDEFDVPMEYVKDSQFQHFAKSRERGLIKFHKRSMQRGKKILPMIKGSLSGQGVSPLFIYLSMIESGFSTHAVSNKKAAGLWQFMPETARNYKLNNIGSSQDERYNAVRSTKAAIRYLKKLHRQFGKWYLAAMAYNCGEGCVERAIKKAGSKKLSILVDNQAKYLPKETRNYIRKILFIAMIGENKVHKVGKKRRRSSDTIKVEVAGGTKLRALAKAIKIKYSLLKKLNPMYKKGIVPKKRRKYSVTIPLSKIYAFYLRYELAHKKKEKLYYLSYQVVLGDTVERIAKKFHVKKKDLIEENHLSNEFLELKQFLIIPTTQKLFDSYQHK